MTKLKMIEKMLDVYYNRGGFENILSYLMGALEKTPFAFYEMLADFYYEAGYQHKNRKKEDHYKILYKFALRQIPECHEEIKENLEKDLAETLTMEEVKRFLKKGWGM